MGTTEQTVQTAAPRQRRVGTFTLGVTMVVSGCGMLAAMLWPRLQPELLLKAAPCILILLGAETLIAARGGGRVKYDWMGMILCFILTVFALALCSAAWWMLEGPGFPVYSGSWAGDRDGLTIRYDYFNDNRMHRIDLTAGDTLEITCGNQEGRVSVEIYSAEDWDLIFARDFTDQDSAQVEIPATGEYYIELYGHKAAGRAAFTRLPGPEAEPAPEGEAVPEGELADGAQP